MRSPIFVWSGSKRSSTGLLGSYGATVAFWDGGTRRERENQRVRYEYDAHSNTFRWTCRSRKLGRRGSSRLSGRTRVGYGPRGNCIHSTNIEVEHLNATCSQVRTSVWVCIRWHWNMSAGLAQGLGCPMRGAVKPWPARRTSSTDRPTVPSFPRNCIGMNMRKERKGK